MSAFVYEAPILTVDTVVFQLAESGLEVLLVRRADNPFKGEWALPGGYCARGETTHEAQARILNAKAGVAVQDLRHIEQLYTFDTVARDPRGHAVSVTYLGLGLNTPIRGGHELHDPRFFPLSELPKLAFDHSEIITYAHERLESKLLYTNAIFALLPTLFTLSQLQAAYEAVLGRELDKRNFRKKFLSLDLISETDEMLKEGAHRPARLFTFKQQTLQTLSRSFD